MHDRVLWVTNIKKHKDVCKDVQNMRMNLDMHSRVSCMCNDMLHNVQNEFRASMPKQSESCKNIMKMLEEQT